MSRQYRSTVSVLEECSISAQINRFHIAREEKKAQEKQRSAYLLEISKNTNIQYYLG